MKASLIITAAGSGSRYDRNLNKLLEKISGISVIERALNVYTETALFDEIIICTSSNFLEEIKSLTSHISHSKVILGGETRQQSVLNGLKECSSPDFVAIADAARPLTTKEMIIKALNLAKEKGSAICAVPAKDTIRRVDKNGRITDNINREGLYNIQTPQIFKYKDILEAHIKFQGENATDDSYLFQKSGHDVFISEGSYQNIKITTKEDILFAEILLNDKK
ncbi:MAG: 2-C-methyl-D-erythritol 4-phosphate cytidylyltransferase [Candidatus Gastranaerophilales bacterium]|nr:2-C-methyl-D-erythritol 4-phosphate cytidylyltransferase [Candidatus Gastranaerophilales bacterium]